LQAIGLEYPEDQTRLLQLVAGGRLCSGYSSLPERLYSGHALSSSHQRARNGGYSVIELLLIIALSLFDESVAQYDTYEFSPAVTTTASNPYLPYDIAPPPGVAPGLGATVDALYLAPGATEWRVVPCFWYQPVQEISGAFLPAGEAEWRCRFAPDVVGHWTYKVQATDAAGTRTTLPSFFDCVGSDGKGWVGVSSEDSRFFELADGSPLLTPLINVEQGNPFNGLERARASLASLGAARFVRWFPTGEGANFHVIPWGDDIRSSWAFGRAGVRTDDTDAGEAFSFRPYYYSNQSLPVPAGDYTLSLRAHVTGERVLRAEVSGRGHIDICASANSLHPDCDYRGDEWQTYTLDIANPSTATLGVAVRGLYVAEDAPAPYNQIRAGTVRVSGVEFKQDGRPSLLIRGNPNTHLYVDQRNAALLDEILRLSEDYGIYHKLTMFHKNDPVLNAFSEPAQYNGNFYSDPVSLWYQRAYTRYFVARWGSSPAVHSVELANENHLTEESYEAGWAFAQNVHDIEPRPMLVSNSFWGWWVASFFDDPRIDYGDKHWYAREGESTNPEVVSWSWDDSAAYVRECQLRFNEYDYDRPIVRGEGGVWPASGCCDQHPNINAVYYHKALWAQVGGPFCWGEWYPRLFPDELGQQSKFAAFERFMAGERPYQYRDFETESGDLRAWGMVTGSRVLLWIDNRLHTWRRVADQEPVPPASGAITIPDMEGLWLVQWWDTTSGLLTGQSTVYASGELVLPVSNLAGDVAVKAVRQPANFQPEVYLPLVQRHYPR
jgi:hypothetical protein